MKAQVIALDAPSQSFWWNGGSALRTRIFDALSIVGPSGETFIVNALSEWAKEMADEPGFVSSKLHKEILRLISEEAAHQRAHDVYNKRLNGNTHAKRLEDHMEASMQEMVGLKLSTRLAFVAAFEQLAALHSAEILRPGSVWLSEGNSHQAHLWRWHSREEIAHHKVSIDVLKCYKVGHTKRIAAFVMATIYLHLDLLYFTASFCRADVRAKRINGWQLIFETLTFTVRAIPSMLRMGWGCLNYLVGREQKFG